MKPSKLSWLLSSLPYLCLFAAGAITTRLAFGTGPETAATATAQTTAIAPASPPSAVCGSSREDMRLRNAVWRYWNGDYAGGIGPDSPLERRLGDALLGVFIWADDPEIADGPDEACSDGLRLYRTAYFQRFFPDRLNFTDLDIDEVEMMFGRLSKAKRMEAMQERTEFDLRAANLAYCVLHDKTRVGLFMAGKQIPLETLPDGTEP